MKRILDENEFNTLVSKDELLMQVKKASNESHYKTLRFVNELIDDYHCNKQMVIGKDVPKDVKQIIERLERISRHAWVRGIKLWNLRLVIF